MVTIEEHIDIDRSPAEVWDYVSDPARVTLYSTNLIDYEQTSAGARGKGTTDRGAAKVAGRRFEFTQEVDAWEPGERVGLRSTAAPMGMSWRIDNRLEDLGDGRTRVHWTQEASLGSFFGKLGEPLVAKMYRRDVAANLANLKTLLEEA